MKKSIRTLIKEYLPSIKSTEAERENIAHRSGRFTDHYR